jgi:AcrR family transcriptional regulator
VSVDRTSTQSTHPRTLHGWRLVLQHDPAATQAQTRREAEMARRQDGTERGAAPDGDSRSPARPVRLSREVVADAALRVGFENLTLAAVAAKLGVSHPALYRHVVGRDDLVAAAVDRLFTTTLWPAPASEWRDFLEAEAWARWNLFGDHPGLVGAFWSLSGRPVGVARRFSVVAGHLVRLGFGTEGAALATSMIYALTLGQVTQPTQLAARTDGLTRTWPCSRRDRDQDRGADRHWGAATPAVP